MVNSPNTPDQKPTAGSQNRVRAVSECSEPKASAIVTTNPANMLTMAPRQPICRARAPATKFPTMLMPMSNATQMTDAERAALGRWYEAGAPAR